VYNACTVMARRQVFTRHGELGSENKLAIIENRRSVHDGLAAILSLVHRRIVEQDYGAAAEACTKLLSAAGAVPHLALDVLLGLLRQFPLETSEQVVRLYRKMANHAKGQQRRIVLMELCYHYINHGKLEEARSELDTLISQPNMVKTAAMYGHAGIVSYYLALQTRERSMSGKGTQALQASKRLDELKRSSQTSLIRALTLDQSNDAYLKYLIWSVRDLYMHTMDVKPNSEFVYPVLLPAKMFELLADVNVDYGEDEDVPQTVKAEPQHVHCVQHAPLDRGGMQLSDALFSPVRIKAQHQTYSHDSPMSLGSIPNPSPKTTTARDADITHHSNTALPSLTQIPGIQTSAVNDLSLMQDRDHADNQSIASADSSDASTIMSVAGHVAPVPTHSKSRRRGRRPQHIKREMDLSEIIARLTVLSNHAAPTLAVALESYLQIWPRHYTRILRWTRELLLCDPASLVGGNSLYQICRNPSPSVCTAELITWLMRRLDVIPKDTSSWKCLAHVLESHCGTQLPVSGTSIANDSRDPIVVAERWNAACRSIQSCITPLPRSDIIRFIHPQMLHIFEFSRHTSKTRLSIDAKGAMESVASPSPHGQFRWCEDFDSIAMRISWWVCSVAHFASKLNIDSAAKWQDQAHTAISKISASLGQSFWPLTEHELYSMFNSVPPAERDLLSNGMDLQQHTVTLDEFGTFQECALRLYWRARCAHRILLRGNSFCSWAIVTLWRLGHDGMAADLARHCLSKPAPLSQLSQLKE
jgi:hypothetical protein